MVGSHCSTGQQLEGVHIKKKKSNSWDDKRWQEVNSGLCETQSETRIPNKFILLSMFDSFCCWPITGVKHREQAGLDQAHQGGDSGAHHSPERSTKGAHSHSQSHYSQAPQGPKVDMWHLLCCWNVWNQSESDLFWSDPSHTPKVLFTLTFRNTDTSY